MDPSANNMCYRKRGFTRKEKASTALVDMKRKGKPGADLCHVYACPVCNRWHIGKDSVSRDVHEKIRLAIVARKRYFRDISKGGVIG